MTAIKAEKTLVELGQQVDVHPNQITKWKPQLLKRAAGVFGPGRALEAASAVDLKSLRAKIGELTLENDPRSDRGHAFSRRGQQSRRVEPKAMIDRLHNLSLTWHSKVLQLSRSSLYCRPFPVSAADLAVMRRIGELHLDYPFASSRMLRDLLRAVGMDYVQPFRARNSVFWSHAYQVGPDPTTANPGQLTKTVELSRGAADEVQDRRS